MSLVETNNNAQMPPPHQNPPCCLQPTHSPRAHYLKRFLGRICGTTVPITIVLGENPGVFPLGHGEYLEFCLYTIPTEGFYKKHGELTSQHITLIYFLQSRCLHSSSTAMMSACTAGGSATSGRTMGGRRVNIGGRRGCSLPCARMLSWQRDPQFEQNHDSQEAMAAHLTHPSRNPCQCHHHRPCHANRCCQSGIIQVLLYLIKTGVWGLWGEGRMQTPLLAPIAMYSCPSTPSSSVRASLPGSTPARPPFSPLA
jgi:hypothetical protein